MLMGGEPAVMQQHELITPLRSPFQIMRRDYAQVTRRCEVTDDATDHPPMLLVLSEGRLVETEATESGTRQQDRERQAFLFSLAE